MDMGFIEGQPAPDRVVVLNDISAMRGGATGVALLSARLLARRGIPVTFVTGDAGEAADLPPGVALLPIGSRHIRDGNRAAAMMRGLWNLRAGDAVRRWVAEHDTPGTVYHLHGWSKILSPAVFRALDPVRDRVVMTAHDFFLTCPTGGYFDWQRKRPCSLRPMGTACLLRHCDQRHFAHKAWRSARQALRQRAWDLSAQGAGLVLAVHEEMLPHLEHGGIGRSRLRALRNPVAPWIPDRVEAERNSRFLFVGRLEEDKGVMLLARAAREAGIDLAFVGQGVLGEALADGFPEFPQLGWQDRAGIARIAAQARAVVTPTRTRESFGIVPLEALGSGIPVVISNNAMLAPEIVAEGIGLACDPHDTAALAAVLRRLAGDDALVQGMSMRAHAAAGRLAPREEAWADALLGIYRQVLWPARGSAVPAEPCREGRDLARTEALT